MLPMHLKQRHRTFYPRNEDGYYIITMRIVGHLLYSKEKIEDREDRGCGTAKKKLKKIGSVKNWVIILSERIYIHYT